MQICGLNFFRVYLRALALSCSAEHRLTQSLLMMYSVSIVLWQARELCFDSVEFILFREKIGMLALLNKLLMLATRAVHVMIVLQSVIWRKKEAEIYMLLEDIDDELQQNLFQHRHKSAGRERFVIRFHLAMEFFFLAVFVCYLWAVQHLFIIFSKVLFLVFMTQTVRARYLQYIYLVDAVEQRLRSLLLAAESSLVETEQKWRCGINICQNAKYGDAMKMYLRRRVYAMKCVYWKITLITRKMSQQYGVSMVLMNVLFVCGFTQLCYVIVQTLESSAYGWSFILTDLVQSVPAIIKLINVCVACESCSRQCVRLRSLLNMSAFKGWQYENFCIDDLRLQIIQNPVEFDVGFNKLNLQTLMAIMVAIFDFVLILMQFIRLTNEW